MQIIDQIRARNTYSVPYSIRRFIARYGVYVSLALLLIMALFVTPDIYSRENLFLNRKYTDPRPQVFEAALPSPPANLARFAHAVDFPLRFD